MPVEEAWTSLVSCLVDNSSQTRALAMDMMASWVQLAAFAWVVYTFLVDCTQASLGDYTLSLAQVAQELVSLSQVEHKQLVLEPLVRVQAKVLVVQPVLSFCILPSLALDMFVLEHILAVKSQ